MAAAAASCAPIPIAPPDGEEKGSTLVRHPLSRVHGGMFYEAMREMRDRFGFSTLWLERRSDGSKFIAITDMEGAGALFAKHQVAIDALDTVVAIRRAAWPTGTTPDRPLVQLVSREDALLRDAAQLLRPSPVSANAAPPVVNAARSDEPAASRYPLAAGPADSMCRPLAPSRASDRPSAAPASGLALAAPASGLLGLAARGPVESAGAVRGGLLHQILEWLGSGENFTDDFTSVLDGMSPKYRQYFMSRDPKTGAVRTVEQRWQARRDFMSRDPQTGKVRTVEQRWEARRHFTHVMSALDAQGKGSESKGSESKPSVESVSAEASASAVFTRKHSAAPTQSGIRAAPIQFDARAALQNDGSAPASAVDSPAAAAAAIAAVSESAVPSVRPLVRLIQCPHCGGTHSGEGDSCPDYSIARDDSELGRARRRIKALEAFIEYQNPGHSVSVLVPDPRHGSGRRRGRRGRRFDSTEDA
jgi:hypothetical protein